MLARGSSLIVYRPSVRFGILWRVLATVALFLTLASSVVAQTPCTGTQTATCVTALTNQSCPGTRFGADLGCTANDVSASITFTQPAATALSSCVSGSTVTIDLIASLGSGMPDRYDLGIFTGEVANNPQLFNAANTCSLGVFPTSSTFSTFFNNDPADNDSCGDFRGGASGVPLVVQGVKVKCLAQAGTNQVGLPFVLSWSQSTVNNGNFATCSAGLKPGTTSKCSSSISNGINLGLVNVSPTVFINLTKTTVPAGATQSFSFTSTATTGTPAWTLAGSATTQDLAHGQTKQITVPLAANGTNTMTITEALATFWEPNVTITCAAAAGAVANPVTVNNATRTITANFTGANFGADCTITNTIRATLTKAFNVPAIATGQTATLTFTIANPASAPPQTGITFTDALPAGLVIASPNGFINTCGGSPTVTATAGAGTFTIGGTGVNAAAGASSCTVAVNVTSSAAGSYTNGAAQITATSANLFNGVTNQILGVYAPPTVTKTFTPSLMIPGATSSMVITVTNPAANPGNLTGATINDTYTGTLQNNATGNVTCSGLGGATLTGGVNGGTNVGFSVGTIVPGGTCTITQSVTATSTNTNTTTAPSASGPVSVTGSTANATLTVGNAITVTKSFGTNPVGINTNSLLTITLSNSNALAASNVAFTDTYPVGLVNNGGAAVTNSCGGTVTVSANATNPGVTSLSGGTIPASSSCFITVNSQSAAVGSYTNTLAIGAVTSTNTPANTSAASDTLLVGRAKLDKVFGGALIIGGTVTLTYSVVNTSAIAVSFTDTLPAGLRVATPSVTGGTCTGGTVTATAGTNTITVASRNSINGTCTITVAVTTVAVPTVGACPQAANTNGNSNISAVTNIGADITDSAAGGGSVLTGTGACVTVLAAPAISKAFTATNLASGGNTNLTVTISNPNASAITLTSVLTDTFPTGMTIGTAGNTGTCTGVTATAGAGNFTVANGTSIAAGGCTIIVNVTSSTGGSVTNTIAIGALTTSAGNNAAAATATLNVFAPPTVAKSFTPAIIGVGGTSSMVITVTNPAANVANVTGVSIDDIYTGTLVNNAAGAVVCSGAGSATLTGGVNAGTNVGFSSGIIVPGGTCTITQSVTATSTNTNSTTAPAATGPVAVTGTAATNVMLTVAQATLTKTWSSSTIADGATTSLIFTLTNSGSNPAQSGIAFTENLPASLRFSSATPTVTFGAGCAGTSSVTQGAPDTIAFSAVAMTNGTAACTITVVAVTNRAGLTNASCAASPAAFTNSTTNITGASNVSNGVTAQCVVVSTVAPCSNRINRRGRRRSRWQHPA